MTPEKAKNKICPLGFSELPPCLTEDCMMWRWNDAEIKNEGYCGLAGKEGAE